ncbi:cofactor assembly of complex C subunit B [Gloeobacter kilaueensis]|uniref:Cofactor assembly of complex C subunit B n=1 Tax=Gloeobacter kilaueensis (strain ATCC BAA-2537 / CCAP 1431/1 / ULC 316 / JS1) TaxID=1183438 RepID=U5QG07_GLOK1|nr:cofactor assembly of complex C subunit B [Gloeobacter kilaueensis]AGY57892.1 hypothetical protein GKIL_1646 [Gloeobacter kilaueensis JS1]
MNGFLRNLPIVAGCLGGSLVMLNHLLSAPAQQTRAEALGLLLAGILILVGLLQQQAQPLPSPEVQLTGKALEWINPRFGRLEVSLALVRRLLLEQTATRSLLVWWQGEVVLRAGVFETEAPLKPGPIVERVLRTGKPVYLVDLRLFPGRIEFDYLPANLQALVCQPILDRGVLLAGSAAVRSFSNQELACLALLAEHLGTRLEQGV